MKLLKHESAIAIRAAHHAIEFALERAVDQRLRDALARCKKGLECELAEVSLGRELPDLEARLSELEERMRQTDPRNIDRVQKLIAAREGLLKEMRAARVRQQ